MSTGDITRILTFSLIANWYGYLLLAGGLFVWRASPTCRQSWSLGQGGLRAIGVLLLVLGAAYLLACRFARRRAWGWKRYRLKLPSWRLAALQAFSGRATGR